MKIGRLILRLAVGGFFVGHGTQKLFGWFGGGGLEQTAQMFENGLGLRPGRRHALAAGVAEAGGGALLVLGAATPISAAMITATMITAVHRVHLSKGPWITNGGYEYNVVLIAAVLALAETGPGSPSVDSARGSKAYGPGYAALALALGILGAAGAHAVAGMTPAPEAAPADAPAQAPAGEAPAGEAPAGEAPAGEAPADSPAA